MTVVSDTTPLIALMKMGNLVVLKDLFGETLIPQAVFSELTANASFKDEGEKIKSSSFLKVVLVEKREAVLRLQNEANLDIGESEAIVLAQSMNASLLLVDEARARKVAKSAGINVAGTIGVLLYAFDKGIIGKTDLEKSIEEIQNSNLRISDALLELLRAKIR